MSKIASTSGGCIAFLFDDESFQKIKNITKEKVPDKLIISRLEEERFQKSLGMTDERFEEISNALLNI